MENYNAAEYRVNQSTLLFYVNSRHRRKYNTHHKRFIRGVKYKVTKLRSVKKE